jgi:hypothetical protein
MKSRGIRAGMSPVFEPVLLPNPKTEGARVTIPLAQKFGAHCAVGRLAKKTSGYALAGTIGTHLTQEESAQPACTNGVRCNASLAPGGRHIRSGTPQAPFWDSPYCASVLPKQAPWSVYCVSRCPSSDELQYRSW